MSPRWVMALCWLGGAGGAGLLLWALARWRRKPALWSSATLACAAGVALLAAALFPARVVELAALPYLDRIRALMAAVSVAVLIVTVESIRRYRLRERYAILWIITGVLILLCAFFPDALRLFSRWFGMQYVTSVVAVIFTFLVLVAFHFSIALSAARDDVTRLAQQAALLEARLADLERRLNPGGPTSVPAGPRLAEGTKAVPPVGGD